jgi:hypothetical protein
MKLPVNATRARWARAKLAHVWRLRKPVSIGPIERAYLDDFSRKMDLVKELERQWKR